MAFTTYHKLSKPAYRSVRYDEEINEDMDQIDAALNGYPGDTPPGSAGNWPDVVPSTGMRWIDTANDQEKVYYNSTWQVVKTFT